jgi:hypothetical protein
VLLCSDNEYFVRWHADLIGLFAYLVSTGPVELNLRYPEMRFLVHPDSLTQIWTERRGTSRAVCALKKALPSGDLAFQNEQFML